VICDITGDPAVPLTIDDLRLERHRSPPRILAAPMHIDGEPTSTLEEGNVDVGVPAQWEAVCRELGEVLTAKAKALAESILRHTEAAEASDSGAASYVALWRWDKAKALRRIEELITVPIPQWKGAHYRNCHWCLGGLVSTNEHEGHYCSDRCEREHRADYMKRYHATKGRPSRAKVEPPHVCPACHSEFQRKRRDAIYCGPMCRKRVSRLRGSPFPGAKPVTAPCTSTL
jgi:hypothetical protein